jgi:hypothetical protein
MACTLTTAAVELIPLLLTFVIMMPPNYREISSLKLSAGHQFDVIGSEL